MDSIYSYHVCCRKELFDSIKSSEGTVHLSDGSSCAIEGIRTISMKEHDGTVKNLDEVWYIPSFRRNLISLSRLNLIDYRWRADGEILKVLHDVRLWWGKESIEIITSWQRAQRKVELQKPMGVQCKVKLQVLVDQAQDVRLRRLTGDIARWSFYYYRKLS